MIFDIIGKIAENTFVMEVRTVFMGTPQFAATVLESLLRSSCRLVAVYTRPDRPAGRGHCVVFSPVKTLALAHRIPVIQPPTLKSDEAVETLASFQPELIVVAAFGLILPPRVLALPESACLNVHPSLLPRHRGPAPVAWAILCGDSVTGITIMLMDSGMDTGPILARETVMIADTDTAGSLGDRLADTGARLLLATLPPWLAGELRPQGQDDTSATYSRAITNEDAEIDWGCSAVALWRKVRAYNPWPVCHTWWQGKRLRIHVATPVEGRTTGQPGQVTSLEGPPRVGVITGDGVLALDHVQLEGKRSMSVDDFVRGQRDFVGSVLGGR